MDETLASGHVRCFGDDINTDYIVPSHRKKISIDPDVLKRYIFEDIRDGFFENLGPRTILVAGKNFGCGSAMEIAVTVLQRAGVGAIIAQSFARTFKRNAINNGLLLCEASVGDVAEDSEARITCGQQETVIHLGDCTLSCKPMPDFLLGIFREGGLIPYLLKHDGFKVA